MVLQRAFSGFPSGCPGWALLVLRALIGGVAIIQSVLAIADAGGAIGAVSGVAGITALGGFALIIGFATPIASGWLFLAGILLIANFGALGPLELLEGRMTQIEFVAIAAALVCLGPGAISLDSRLYGRREIAVTDPVDPQDS
jgi:uncharacterized membrane protein YphA (DoxX/SURF4 family)